MEQAKKMAHVIYDALADKKGEDIRIIDISNISVIADYFIITDGTNENQVRALVDSVDEKMEKAGYRLKQQEGQGSAAWVLMDYGDVIVHVFEKENRAFYCLDKIWRDGKTVDIKEL